PAWRPAAPKGGLRAARRNELGESMPASAARAPYLPRHGLRDRAQARGSRSRAPGDVSRTSAAAGHRPRCPAESGASRARLSTALRHRRKGTYEAGTGTRKATNLPSSSAGRSPSRSIAPTGPERVSTSHCAFQASGSSRLGWVKNRRIARLRLASSFGRVFAALGGGTATTYTGANAVAR